jgi:curved DNA-binding protein CbpA
VRADFDPYAVLGVPPDATPDQIRQALRRRSKQAHPDAGGTEAEMIEVLAAWEVLKDPVRRAAHDRGRAAPADPAAAAAGAAAEAEARERAAAYPRSWADFERWMDAAVGDVARAEYGEAHAGLLGKWPTAHGSLTGGLFILAGALAAFGLFTRLDWYGSFLASLFAGKPRVGGSSLPMSAPMILLAALPLLAGAWAGRIAHQALRDHLRARAERARAKRPADPPAGVGAAPLVLRCPRCRQRLRLPRNDRLMDVTCPKCRCKFGHDPTAATAGSSSTAGQTS